MGHAQCPQQNVQQQYSPCSDGLGSVGLELMCDGLAWPCIEWIWCMAIGPIWCNCVFHVRGVGIGRWWGKRVCFRGVGVKRGVCEDFMCT